MHPLLCQGQTMASKGFSPRERKTRRKSHVGDGASNFEGCVLMQGEDRRREEKLRDPGGRPRKSDYQNFTFFFAVKKSGLETPH